MVDRSPRSSALLSAYHHVKRTGEAVRKAGRMFGVPESTLRARMSNPDLFNKHVGHPNVFSRAEEAHLAEHCKKMARLGYGYCRWQVLQMAANMANETNRVELPKKDWYYGFIKRFPDISIQKPKKREMSRVRTMSNVNVENYFSELDKILTKYELKNKPGQIWNIDETGITLDHTPPKIVAAKGEKPFVVTAGHSATTTVIAAGNALGETIPPYVIYKGQRLTEEITRGCLPGTKYITTQNGWSTMETFHDFILNHVLSHVQSRPCLLLYDGHSTHVTIDLIEKAREKNIHLFVLPPHSSHQLQPLDVGIFSPFKAALSSECHKLSHSEVGRQVTRSDLPGLIGTAYKSALTVPNLMSAFRKTGIVPFNPDILKRPVEMPLTVQKSKSRKERANERSVKLLLSDIDQNTESSLSKPQERKRSYIIPQCGAAITELEFLEKLKESKTETNEKKPKKSKSQVNKKVMKVHQYKERSLKKKSKDVKKSNHTEESNSENKTVIIERVGRRPIKRRLFSDYIVPTHKSKELKNQMIKKKSCISKESDKVNESNKVSKMGQLNKDKENQAPEVIDSQEAGPSNTRRNEWLTFYPSDSDDSSIDDDDATCVICNLKSPTAFEKQIRIDSEMGKM